MLLKKIAAAAVVALLLGSWALRERDAGTATTAAPVDIPATRHASARPGVEDPAAAAFARRARGVMVSLEGHVDRVLADDRDGSRHQRFIFRTFTGHTVLVAHNIDLAPRLESLQPGEALTLRGEYEWNAQGGVVHWTHHDPDGSHPGGYIERSGRRYQ